MTKAAPITEHHPEILQIIGLDTEWTRVGDSRSQPAPLEAEIDFYSPSRKVAEQVQRACDAIRAKIWMPDHPHERDYDHLYRVMPFMPIGHTDLLVLLLTDDLEVLHDTMASTDTTIEEVSLGFCPFTERLFDMVSLPGGEGSKDGPVHSKNEEIRKVFVSPRKLFSDGEKVDLANGVQVVCSSAPFLMFTSLKLEGMSALGLGLEMEHAIDRSILRSLTTSVLRILEKDADLFRDLYGVNVDTLTDDLRISLLDLQSQEEIGLLILTPNLTLGEALLARLQGLTLEDAFQENPRLREVFDRLPYIEKMRRFGDGHQEPDEPHSSYYGGNHLFRWLRTTAALRYDGRGNLEQMLGNASGWIESFTEIQLPTGHQGWLHDKGGFKPLRGTSTNAEFSRHSLGRCDCMVYNGKPPGDPGVVDTFQVRDFFGWVESTIRQLREKSAPPENCSRALAGWSTTISIPVPISKVEDGSDYYCPPIKPNHRPPFDAFLRHLKSSLFQKDLGGGGHPPLSRASVEQKLANATLPEPLKRSVVSLFDNFGILLTNPHLFEQVVDLLDVFQTLHGSLDDWNGLGCHPGRVERLCRFAGTLNWALEHRLYRAFPEDRMRDADIDYRGGLNQLISAVDTVQKCAIGVIRHDILKDLDEESSDGDEAIRNKIGVLQWVGFRPGIEMQIQEFGPKERHLAVVRTDVSHLHHVPSFHDFWHEAFHLAQDVLQQKGRIGEWNWPPVLAPTHHIPPDSENELVILQRRLSEIFAHTLTALFISPNEPEIIGKHLALQFACSMRSLYDDDELRLGFYLEKRLEFFLAREALQRAKEHVRQRSDSERRDFWAFDWSEDGLLKDTNFSDAFFGTLEEQSDRARGYLSEMARFHHEFHDLFENETRRPHLDEKIRRFLVTARPFMGRLLGISFEVISRFRIRIRQENGNGISEEQLEAIEKRITECIGSGSPKQFSDWHEIDGQWVNIDNAITLCAILRGTLAKRVKIFEDALCLQGYDNSHRCAGSEVPSESAIYCDPLAGGGMVCRSRALRRERAARYISVLKTCEGGTSVLRANRVAEICDYLIGKKIW